MNTRHKAEEIFRAGINAVLPSVLIPEKVKLEDDSLIISGNVFQLKGTENIYVIGAGKATALMASEIEKVLGNRITAGHIVVKYGHSYQLEHIKVTEAGHPVPDQNGFDATRSILKIAREAGINDLMICLISGGGSALLADYPEGATPGDMMTLNSLLVNCGASITEINAVRKHLSGVKGGQLAKAAFPATLVSMVLSDVAGDPLDVIASGPASPDPTTYGQALEVLKNYGIIDSVPYPLVRRLEEGVRGLHPETPDKDDPVFSKTHNILIGTNSTALEAARAKALQYNMNAQIITSCLQGDVVAVSDYLLETALKYRENADEIKPVCLLFGGETTVKMSGTGEGGRNQHLALLSAVLLKDHPGITVLAGGTDGNDGPTDAAGAVVDSLTCSIAVSKGITPEDFISNFDSYNFFRETGGHVITGPTMTNVMDVIVLIIE